MQILSNCSLTRSPVPHILLELSRECQCYESSPANDLTLISADFWKLRSERPFRPRASDPESVDRNIIHRCRLLTIALTAWRRGLAQEYVPSCVPIEDARADVLGDDCHIYPTVAAAILLNQHRRLVVLVHELALVRLLNLQRRHHIPEGENMRIQDCCQEIVAHVHLICASVPFLLNSGHPDAARSLLWPLFVSAQLHPAMIEFPNKQTREWIIKQLSYIACDMGIGQGRFLVKALMEQQEITEMLEND